YPKTNLNLATFEELVQVPYIGEFTAKRILEQRGLHGPFQSVDQLLEIKGVYEKNFLIFRNYLSVDENGH
ncbi:MAG: helix-hairpin-helix domain-containing protein, partial [Candidatus Omnitrophica bacterium]|nr:helix-hairpin-helix domain-containing protein [Candidatus Omnitrophota bacterium]